MYDMGMAELPAENRHQDIKALILDMDGVLWRGSEPIGDLPSIFAKIARRGLRVTFATNNSTRTISQYVDALGSYGVKVFPEQIVTSAVATGEYLKNRYDGDSQVFVIGEKSLTETLATFGFVQGELVPKAVVIGLDRQLTYNKLLKASKFILGGSEFIGTNPDPNLPTPEGLIPGTGSILAAVQAATGVQPTIIGKPSPELFSIALDRLGTRPEETLVVGDRIETDIAGGIAAGCLTGLVLTGVTTANAASNSRYKPSYQSKDFESLLDMIL
jgi:4-nitrophenyl phosphatase